MCKSTLDNFINMLAKHVKKVYKFIKEKEKNKKNKIFIDNQLCSLYYTN